MKKAKKDPFDERSKIVKTICDILKDSFTNQALLNKLSPLEMITVFVVLSSSLLLKLSKHLGCDIAELIEMFNVSMTEYLEMKVKQESK